MTNRPSEDNVIYANFGARRRVYTPEEAGESRVGPAAAPSRSPAAMRVLNAAVRQTDAARVKRGHSYAANGHVVAFEFRSGGVDGEVAGSQNEPFAAGFRLPRRSRAELDEAMRTLAATPGAQQRAQSGDFPDAVLDVLISSEPSEVNFYCDCPDAAVVCKHAVAVAEVAAQHIDEQPSLIYAMRDMGLGAVQDTLRRSAHTIAAENAEAGSEYFWPGRELPALPTPKVAPMIDDSDLQLLRTAMGSVSFTNIDQMFAVADIEHLYDMLIDD